MHPIIARFLDLDSAVSALEKEQREDTMDADETALAHVAGQTPGLVEALVDARGKKAVAPGVQQQLIVLATRAATHRLSQDPLMGPRIASAIAALKAQGASEDEASMMVSQAVLEEAFGFAEDPDRFDKDFLGETLDSLAHLGALNQDLVNDWIDAWAHQGDAAERPLRLKVADTLLQAAWGDGPQPINPEHLDEALEHLSEELARTDLPKAAQAMASFLAHLSTKHVVGATRLSRLTEILKSALGSGELEDGEEEEADEDEA